MQDMEALELGLPTQQSGCDRIPLHAELARSAYPKAAKPRGWKSGTLPVIQAPKVRLLGQSLREAEIASMH
jgi:hypothetical protein